MRKFIIVLAILTLVSGVAYAIDSDQVIANEYAARNIGRAVVTDSSVIMKVWCTGGTSSEYVGVGVSSSTSVIVYTNYMTGTGTTLGSSSTALDTVGEMVDHINAGYNTSSTVKIFASVGNDAYRSMATTTLVPANIITCGITKTDTLAVVNKQTNDRITAGAEEQDGVINRIKSLNATLDILPSALTGGYITLRVYDGDTQVWRKVIPQIEWITAGSNSASPSTVEFPEVKGISSTKGNGLVAECVASTQYPTVTASERVATGMNIVYDRLKE